jgi:hypothetical protein
MDVFKINDPYDVLYPLSKDNYDNPRILYHGTSSIYSEIIEKNGWEFNTFPHDMQDFVTLVDIYKKIGWDGISGSIYSLKSFTLGGDGSYVETKPVSFSQDYHIARNYSINRGGESVKNLMVCLDEIVKICDDDVLRNNHISEIETELNQNLTMQKQANNPEVLDREIFLQKSYLENLTSNFLIRSKPVILDLKKKYSQMIKNHTSVVYVIKSEFDSFEEGDLKYGLCGRALELRPITSISPSSIIAKIIFIGGVEYIRIPSNVAQPVKWDTGEWNKYCEENKENEFKINEFGVFGL